MCTLILLDRIVPDVPILVAANRDEFFARPAAPPALFEPPGGPAYVAPQDLEAGGTWMGINSSGLFAGLTNRPVDAKDATRRSRGLLVSDALGCDSVAEVAARIGDGLEQRYNPFHLLVADGERTLRFDVSAKGTDTAELDPGVHVVGNLDPDDPRSPKLREIQRDVERIDPGGSYEQTSDALIAVLSDHRHDEPHQNACVHTDGYGTRSSAVIAHGLGRRAYWASDGPPCRAKFNDFTRLLDAIQPAPHREDAP